MVQAPSLWPIAVSAALAAGSGVLLGVLDVRMRRRSREELPTAPEVGRKAA